MRAKHDPALATHPVVNSHIKAAVIIHPPLCSDTVSSGRWCRTYWLQPGEFPKGSVSMRTRSSFIQYLRAGRTGEGGRAGGAQVTRPALASQFGNMLRRVGQQNVRPAKHFPLIVELRHKPLVFSTLA